MQLGLSALISADAAISSDAQFVSKLGNMLLNKDDGATKYDLMVVEDGDALMKPRTEGNLGLNSLLTSTSGLGNEGKFKLVITTNAEDTSDIDAALLRPGRCFDIMEFGRLTAAEGNAARTSLGRPPVSTTGELPLAAWLNSDVKTMRSGQNDSVSIVSPRFPLKKK